MRLFLVRAAFVVAACAGAVGLVACGGGSSSPLRSKTEATSAASTPTKTGKATTSGHAAAQPAYTDCGPYRWGVGPGTPDLQASGISCSGAKAVVKQGNGGPAAGFRPCPSSPQPPPSSHIPANAPTYSLLCRKHQIFAIAA